MIDFIPTPYKLIGIAIGAALIFAMGYLKGYDNANDKYLAFKAEVQANSAILEANAEKARLESERVTADVSKAWAAALNHARANPRIVRVRDTSCDPTGLRPLSQSAGLTPPAGPESELGATVDVAIEQCEALLNKAVMDAAQLTHLQAWVKQQSEVQR